MTEQERKEYCKNCDRSIFSNTELAKSCDINVENSGDYVLADTKCYCKIVNGMRAEKYSWERNINISKG